ncbi:MAG: sensor histidine kinase [Gammaproteobacteria bacterium]|nr:MAG: sensor histidine kinase [Gammaproteobacteria bacterium]
MHPEVSLQMAETPAAADPGPELRERQISWSALRLLPTRLWVPLCAVLLTTLTLAAVGEWSAQSALTRLGLFVLTVVTLGLLLAVTRLLLIEAERQARLRGAAQQQKRELDNLVEARTGELSALSTHLQELAEKEKSELARNLHDELGGLLTAAKMDLSWLQSRVDAPPIHERLAQLGGVLDEAMDLKRRLVETLRPSLLDHFGLATALRAYVDAASAKAGLQCEILLAEDGEPLPRDVAIALFRIVQEGLTNIVRHAEAHHVRLQVTSDGAAYVFTLSDDGRGFDPHGPQVRRSHGIMGMRQRVRALGGELTLESSLGRGTTLRVRVPKAAPGR